MPDLNIPIAFIAGLVSFFAPCVVPLLPAYIGYVTGVSMQELSKQGLKTFRKKMFVASLYYVFGFSLVFVLLGSVAAGFGSILQGNRVLLARIGGLVIFVFGLEFAGLLQIPFLAKTKQFKLPGWIQKMGNLRAFAVGVVFAAVWSPCIGAVLGSILVLTATSATALKGAFLLFVFSLGISIPFLVATLAISTIPKYLTTFTKYAHRLSVISGILLALLGLLLATNTYKHLNSWVFEIAYSLGYTVR